MDRSLDDIVSERHSRGPRGRRGGGGGRRNDRNDFPRDGVRKSTREEPEPRNLDSEWVHDKYDDEPSAGRRPGREARRYSPEPTYNQESAKLKVENIHYDLTQDDLEDLFNRIGPVQKLELLYDRQDRSRGIAFVTYESYHDAKRAIREYDGANANGQPIRLTPAASGPGPRARNPFDTAVRPPRPLADRISIPGGTRSRSRSPVRHSDVSGLAPEGVDRYVPGQGGRRSRSPLPRRREGRRPGDRRERGERRGGGRDMGRQGGRDGGRDGGARTVRRPAKTQEELDAEMDDYFNNGTGKDTASAGAVAAEPAPQDGGDVDMIE